MQGEVADPKNLFQENGPVPQDFLRAEQWGAVQDSDATPRLYPEKGIFL